MPSPSNYKDHVAYIEMMADHREGKQHVCSYAHLRDCGWSSEDIQLLKKIEWRRNIEKNNCLIKRLKEKDMCNGDQSKLASSVPKEENPEIGSKWTYGGDVYTVKEAGLRYFNNRDGSPAQYVVVETSGGTKQLATHAALRRDFKRWQEELKPVYFTPRLILSHNPCEDGIVALGASLGVSSKQDKAWQAVNAMSAKGCLDASFKVSELYTWYTHTYDRSPSTPWLLFLAKAANLIPSMVGTGPDRSTLKRLLGIPAE